jgi:hypothetical protein
VLHNLVLETTRMSIEVKNLRMRLESLSSRLDFSERRVRALEGVVQYRPEAMRRERREPLPEAAAGAATEGVVAEGLDPEALPAGPRAEGDSLARRRRRRRRGRRGQREGFGATAPEAVSAGGTDSDATSEAGPETEDAEASSADSDPSPFPDEQ